MNELYDNVQGIFWHIRGLVLLKRLCSCHLICIST